MELLSPIDAIFLIAESREHPMHVGGLQLFEAPEDAGPEFARTIHSRVLADHTVSATFRKRPATWLGAPQLGWSQDPDVDLAYHVRRSALPSPGGVEQLLDLASRLHGQLLDRHRPLWEIRVVEGLADGRFALYTKMHHALIDGVAAQRLMQRTLTSDPAEREVRVPWNLPRRPRTPKPESSGLGGAARNLLSAGAFGPKLARAARSALLEQQLTLPFEAPRTMLNVPIGGARTVAVRSWPLERIKQVKKATGKTINDVVLAMSSGALRRYLAERAALPDKSLIAMVPMNLRGEDDTETSGNKVCAALCNLGTDVTDPLARLTVISESMHDAKTVYKQLSSTQAMALSAVTLSPMAMTLLPALVQRAAPPFNIVISNVPGAREPMYFNGARLDASYPMSIPLDGQAMNITLTTTAANLDFGLVGCRRSVPDMHRILDHLESSLAEMEDAI
ncbi:wax ester/triacylglycerol synthase family O-acyltransferase [Nocardia sp. NPDC127579]|uniref:WS/DGAT/MGAT family O-acyltransferase n=1 Tax=Nocardia sp. NPDC127579 TaxID=3345402 RepID=UPI00362FA8F2